VLVAWKERSDLCEPYGRRDKEEDYEEDNVIKLAQAPSRGPALDWRKLLAGREVALPG